MFCHTFNVQVYFSFLYISAQASSSTLYMPENVVAHGDASLAVDDFLARTDGQLKRGSRDGPTVDTP
jgi:SAC3 family protein LENG8/THP3